MGNKSSRGQARQTLLGGRGREDKDKCRRKGERRIGADTFLALPSKGKFKLLPGWRGSTTNSSSSTSPPAQYGVDDSQEECPAMETLASFCGEVQEDECTSSDSEEEMTPRAITRPRRNAISAEATGVWNPRRAGKMPPTFEKTAEHAEKLRTALKACPFFKELDDETMKLLVDVMPIEEDVPEGKKIIQQGDLGDAAFVLLDGSCYVCDEDGQHQIYAQKTVEIDATRVTGDLQRITEDTKDAAAGAKNPRKGKMGTMAAGRFFGELAMLWGCMRTVSVFARETCVLAKLDREAYTNVVILRSIDTRNMRTECLRKAKLLETLQDEDITFLADALELRLYKEGEEIIQQGSYGHEFFVVQSGECSASIRTGDGNGSTGADVQEHRRYGPGELFGERALLQRTYRAATVKACVPTEVLVLSRRKFERLLGSLALLSDEHYLTDPRKSIADFYRAGDSCGPAGSREFNTEKAKRPSLGDAYGDIVDPYQRTDWFAVYRPTSRDAISKMLSGNSVGKGLNVKGKSAKGGRLSGYVPFLQIHDNAHKQDIEESPPDARVRIYYQTELARQEAMGELQKVLSATKSDLLAPPSADGSDGKKAVGKSKKAGSSPANQRSLSPAPGTVAEQRRPSPVPGKGPKAKARKPSKLAAPKDAKELKDGPTRRVSGDVGPMRAASGDAPTRVVSGEIGAKDELRLINDYDGMYGLDMPEYVMREVYITKPDLTFLAGWETGRNSEPAFMDMNLHAVRGDSLPQVAMIQIDRDNPLNPQGLLIAYAEAFVKPVVSDFDTFLVGSRGMIYEELPEEQGKLASWTLDNALEILKKPDLQAWNSRWLEVLRKADEGGFHPLANVPKYGFGDNASYRLTAEVVEATSDSGAVRHGAECFNFSFPQELDDEYLVVWEHFPDKPWNYLTEEALRPFLLERVAEGFSFPLNPVWPVRDPGWYEVFEALQGKLEAAINLTKWFPQESGLMQKMEAIHKAYPKGFERKAQPLKKNSEMVRNIPSMVKVTHLLDLNSRERADFVQHRRSNPQALLKTASKLADVFEDGELSRHL